MFRRPHGRPQSRYGGMPRRRRIIRTRYSSPEETAQQEPAPPGGRIAHALTLPWPCDRTWSTPVALRALRVLVTRDGWRDRTWWRRGFDDGAAPTDHAIADAEGKPTGPGRPAPPVRVH